MRFFPVINDLVMVPGLSKASRTPQAPHDVLPVLGRHGRNRVDERALRRAHIRVGQFDMFRKRRLNVAWVDIRFFEGVRKRVATSTYGFSKAFERLLTFFEALGEHRW